MARSRDLQRQADLRNIASAIQMYAARHGTLPFSPDEVGIPTTYSEAISQTESQFWKKATDLSGVLQPYISQIPTDPKKNTFIDLCK